MSKPFKQFPSPEQLFHIEDTTDVSVSAIWQEPIPEYRVVKNHSVYMFLGLIVFIAVCLNLDQFGFSYYTMMSGSMQTDIPKGSFVLVRKVKPDRLKEGDIITFWEDSGFTVTHQIIKVYPDYQSTGEPAFETKGTENKTADAKLVRPDQIKGKVLFHIPGLGNILMYPKTRVS